MKRLPIVLMAAAMLGVCSCDLFTGNDSDKQGDSINELVDSTKLIADSVITVQGEAVDGSRRNIYLQVGDSTYSFELDPSLDVEWEIGDSLTVRYIPTQQGDSVIEVKNSNV